MTIRTRLALLFTLAALLIVGGAALLFSDRLSKGLDQGLDGRLQSRAAVLLSVLTSRDPDSLVDLPIAPADGYLVQVIAYNGTVLRQSHGLTDPLLTAGQVDEVTHRPISGNTTAQIASPADPGGQAVRVYATVVKHKQEVLVVAINRELTDSAVAKATHELVMWCLGLMLLAGPAGWLLTRAALAPVERLRKQFASLDPTEVEPLIEVSHRRDEIGRLATTFNDSYLKLRASVERERAFVERERAFVVDAGHELRTPLAVLKGELELGRRPGRTIEQLHETMAVASEETDRLIKLSEDLLFLARDEEAPTLRLRSCDVMDLARQAVSATIQAGSAAGVRITIDGPDDLPVEADGDRIYRALLNVVTNAVRATAPSGHVAVTVAADDAQVSVIVEDDGPGFPADLLPIAFERFTRSLEDGHTPGGNGLGLAIVRSAMITHNGTVHAENRSSGGARVQLTWPLTVPASAAQDAKQQH